MENANLVIQSKYNAGSSGRVGIPAVSWIRHLDNYMRSLVAFISKLRCTSRLWVQAPAKLMRSQIFLIQPT